MSSQHKVIPRKRFGQHFLIDQSVVERIISFIEPKPTDNLIEIGPGMGALTIPVLKKAQKMNVIELDVDLIPVLEAACNEIGEISIYAEDALLFDFSSLVESKQRMRIIGNLPYNISTPLLFHLLEYAGQIQDMHFMLQKEVVERLAAAPGSEHYGRLSVMVQYQCAVIPLLLVSSNAFLPPPKVESKVVRLIPHAKLPYVVLDQQLFVNIVRQAFAMRRKTLRNALKRWVDAQIWEMTKIDSQLRPEELSVKDYVELCNVITRHQCS